MFEREAKLVDREDRISELPVHIIYHILCYCTKLNLKEAARSCILSKRWYYCWISRPHLIFDQFEGNKYMPLEKYVKLVDRSLRSHIEQNLRLELLILRYRDEELDSQLDTWIELAVKLNVTLLGISLPLLRSLPDAIYAAKKLTVLWLCRCKFEFDISTTCIRFCCLRDLSLYDVHISDDQLQRPIERSPYIRNLKLQNCQGISKLHVFGLVYLEDLAAQYSKFDSVIVQAPNLRCFTYAEHEDNFLPREIAIFWMVTILYKHSSSLFPNISELNLTECYKLKNIEIQSEKLKIFTLLKLKSLEKVTVQAPNLLEFDFVGDKMPFSSMDPSSLERAQLVFSSPSTNFGSVDSSWYTNLHHFVPKTKNIIIYENPREIVISPSHDGVIFIAPILRVESIIGRLMRYCPRTMSIIPCTDSKVFQVLSVLEGCAQKQNCGEECPFNTELFHRDRILKEVISCTGTIEEGMVSIWYFWLKSTSLIDQMTNFMAYDGTNKIKTQSNMAKRVCVDGEDRISELPVHIIHQILCRTDLDLKEAARSCILSKRWYFCWTSRPNLIFHQLQNYRTYSHMISCKNYVKLVDQSLRSHVEQNLHLQQLVLIYWDLEVDSHVDTWIELAFKLNVRVLDINASFLIRPYSLPNVIYDAKKLTTLWLRNCKFEFDISTTHIRFDCLEDLHLHEVHISDAQLQRIIDRSPFIRTLTLFACPGISKLQVCGPVHLENLIVVWCKFDSVMVQAPNLQCFKYDVHYIDHPCEIAILDGYNTLQTLELAGASITDQQFRDLSYKFPNISELNLTSCNKLKIIEIQSEKLTKFTLDGLSLEKFTIQAPNLLEIDFYGGKNALLIYGSFFPGKSPTQFLVAEHKLWISGQFDINDILPQGTLHSFCAFDLCITC
ncbi:hypothetical protein H5410_062572 [Solanum commersonii]|uniref:F-box domain-containing protein n=1 Tax=Solanum commersonii TaxID=4109 RepID=A0A9J5WD23_SOLCO|nr:hypothetical protein H5410_062572 [Solanum commersonii]